ncbi:WecB/TagA/CpsF family glycosyltransferase [Patescibacteria group bacterium]|nr:WecB/TagA/CpsF family glycosyltransferase [Patescibacteria group bacterium]
MNFQCFGLVINGYDLDRIIQEILTRSSLNRSTWIVTANPEILLHAKTDTEYWEALRQADLRTVDGFGLKLAGYLSGAQPKRISGVDLANTVVKLCIKQKWTLLLIGGSDGTADQASWNLRKKYPELKVFAEQGGSISIDGTADQQGNDALTRTQDYEPDVILVGFGHPKQEKWILKYRNHFSKTKLFIGVGGTLDFWSYKTKRAPLIIQKIGLEWLWRLILEPKRWKRIWNAVIIFPIKFLTQ